KKESQKINQAVTREEKKDPLYKTIIEEEIETTTGLIRRDETSISPIVKELEKEWTEYIGAEYCLAQNNGTSTLHAAYFAVGVEPGDEVITPVFTWHLGVTPLLAAHGIPVFCDCDPLTLNIDPAKIEEKITSKTRAISVCHVYGHPVDMDPIVEIAGKHNLAVIEDASHAHGAEYKGRKIGSIGDIGCFSLQGSKLMIAGEGGLLVTNNLQYYERAIMLGHYERIPSLTSKRYQKYKAAENVPPMNYGFKYRIHPFAAGIAKVQLRYLEHRNDIERRNHEYLSKGLAEIEGVDPPYIASYATKVTWLNYLARFYPEKFKGVSREKIINALKAEGVPSGTGRTGYIPLHLQPLIQEHDMYGKGCPWRCRYANPQEAYSKGDFPVAEKMYKERISLPIFRDVIFDSELLDQFIEAFRKIADNIDELR
ncbi:DegT/DnrJ/EryC1/StrS family aminotransferase, partial [Verrucomicrobiota bacterium]